MNSAFVISSNAMLIRNVISSWSNVLLLLLSLACLKPCSRPSPQKSTSINSRVWWFLCFAFFSFACNLSHHLYVTWLDLIKMGGERKLNDFWIFQISLYLLARQSLANLFRVEYESIFGTSCWQFVELRVGKAPKLVKFKSLEINLRWSSHRWSLEKKFNDSLNKDPKCRLLIILLFCRIFHSS